MATYSTVDELLAALYGAVSGPAGPRSFPGDPPLFHAAARLTRTLPTSDQRAQAKAMSPAEYLKDTAPFFAGQDFWEVEIGRRFDRFGNIAHVLSVYEARLRPDEARPERRGVNSIQLFHDGVRWWIMNMIWDNEREGLQVPPDWYA